MKSSISKLVQAILTVLAVCLTAALFVPTHSAVPVADQSVSPVPSPAQPAQQQSTLRRASHDAILSLFLKKNMHGPSPLAFPTRNEPPKSAPVPAPFLSYLGFYTGSPGTPCYLLKDTRTGRVIAVSQGASSHGWSLIAIDDKRITVQNNDEYYVVDKR